MEGSPSLQIIEISSDSEDDVVRQPHLRTTRQGQDNHHGQISTWDNEVIELTDSDTSNSTLPDMLSPLVKGLRAKRLTGSRQRPPSEKSISIYVDTSDDAESDKDCILVLNDPLGSRRPIRSIPLTRDAANDSSLPDSPKKNTLSELSRDTRKSPSKGARTSVLEAKEQARRQEYAADLFAQLNKDVFRDRLPGNTTLEWNKRLLTTAGRARWHRFFSSREGVHIAKIELASKILDCDERIRNTLSHEMCHLACWVIDKHPQEGHGQLFKSWADKVMHKRPDIHISTRHNYEILYPYEWKCEKCSKIYGRYSKSIRPDEYVCGACKVGKLIPLFVERKPTKVSRMAMVKPRVAGSAKRDCTSPSLTNPVEKSISNLADTFRGITIDDSMGQ